MFRYRCVGHPLVFARPNKFMTLFCFFSHSETIQWSHPQIMMQGDLPPPRPSHFVAFVYPRVVVISGGEGMYIFNIPTRRLLRPEFTAVVMPPPCCAHIIVQYKKKNWRTAAGTDCRHSATSQHLMPATRLIRCVRNR